MLSVRRHVRGGTRYELLETLRDYGRARLGDERAGELFVLQEGIGAGEVGTAGDEGRAAGARTSRVVVDGDLRVGGLEGSDPPFLCCGLRGRAGGVDRAGQCARGAAAGRCAGFVRGAGGQGEGGCHSNDRRAANVLEIHKDPFQGLNAKS